MLEILNVLSHFIESFYFAMFLIIGKELKHKRLSFMFIIIFEYMMLKQFIHFDVHFQFVYTFMSFINLKVLYKEKAQITDIFLFMIASIILIISSAFWFIIISITIKQIIVALIMHTISIFLFLFCFKNKIRSWYKGFYSLWNRHHNPNKIKSLTIRNISIVSFNIMFWIINLGMIYAKFIK